MKYRNSILLLSTFYLDSTYVVHTCSINHPDNKVEMRTCDYAAYLIQEMSGAEFGAGVYIRNDAVVDRARAWVQKNLERK